ncbi:MAG: hypothetical protein ACP5KJ_04100, partial [Candidatus Micrarchaeia archaeon]
MKYYRAAIEQLKTAVPGDEKGILSDLITKVGKLDGPAARMFKLDENMPWEYNYAKNKKIDPKSSTAKIEVLLKISEDKEFVELKQKVVNFLNNFPTDPYVSAYKAFKELPLQTQYQLIQFMKEQFGINKESSIYIPDMKKFSAFVNGLTSLSPHSSAYFLKRYGKLVYTRFKTEDISRIMQFIGSRTMWRELAHDYKNLKAYVDSLEKKFTFVLALDIYTMMNKTKERPGSVTIESPGGKEFSEVFNKATGYMGINNIMTLFEDGLNSIIANIAEQRLTLKEPMDLFTDQKLLNTRMVTDYNTASSIILGELVNFNINPPEGYITVPEIGLDLYALDDTEPEISSEFTNVDVGITSEGGQTITEEVGAEKGKGYGRTDMGRRESFNYDIAGRGSVVGPASEVRTEVEASKNVNFSLQEKEEETTEKDGTTTSHDIYLLSNENSTLTVKNKTRNTFIPKLEVNIIESEFLYDASTIKSKNITEEEMERLEEKGVLDKTKDIKANERKLIALWLDANAPKGATSVARLLFDEDMIRNAIEEERLKSGEIVKKTRTERIERKKFEVEVFHRTPEGSFAYAGTFELTPEQANQVYTAYRKVLGEGKSFQVGYSGLLMYDKNIFDNPQYIPEGVEAMTQVKKIGAGGVYEKKMKGPDKGLGIATYSFEPRVIGAGMVYINPEFVNIFSSLRGGGGLERGPTITPSGEKLEEPKIGVTPQATIEELNKPAEEGLAVEGVYIHSDKLYADAFVSATNALRAGALVKYAKEILAGAGGYMETGKTEGGGAAAYISNKEQTLFALASLLGQKQYGWTASTAARYIGEAMGAKVVGVYDKDEVNKSNALFVGSELSFNNLGFADEIRLYYVAGKKVENALKQIQQIGGVDYLKGKFEVEVAGGAGDVLGEGMVSKVWLYNIIDKADFKLHITGLFGELKGGEGIGVEGTLWTGGLGLGLQAGRLRLVAIPISYWK